jgi:hypothetical protein
VLARAIAGLNKSRDSFRIQARAANGGGSNTGIITGAVVGGVLLVGLIAATIALCLDRKRHKLPPPTYQWLDSAGLKVVGAIPVGPRAQNLSQAPSPVVTQLPPIPSTSPIYLSPSQTIPPQSSSPPPNQHTVYTQPSPPPLSHLSTDASQYSAPSFYNPDQRQHEVSFEVCWPRSLVTRGFIFRGLRRELRISLCHPFSTPQPPHLAIHDMEVNILNNTLVNPSHRVADLVL